MELCTNTGRIYTNSYAKAPRCKELELHANWEDMPRTNARQKDILLSKLIRRPLPLNADRTPFFRPFWPHSQLLIGLAAWIVVQSLDLACVALHRNIVEAADR